MKNYKCIIFDVDGTLVESLQGILNALNMTFKEFGINVTRTYEEGKHFIGVSSVIFAKRAMEGLNIPVEKQEEIIQVFLKHYLETQKTCAKVFDGILDFLRFLKENGYLVCIATNKPQMLLEPLVVQLFGDFPFDAVLGCRPNIPIKPDPHIVFEIMNKFNLNASDCLYVGDSEYDYKTANNAGIDSLILTYGYGFYDQEWFKKVTYSCGKVADLYKILK